MKKLSNEKLAAIMGGLHNGVEHGPGNGGSGGGTTINFDCSVLQAVQALLNTGYITVICI